MGVDRRTFLKLTGVAGGGLVLGFNVSCSSDLVGPDGEMASEPLSLNAYVQISQDGIFIQSPNPEIGQGVNTSLPMIVAEELDARWEDIIVLQSEVNETAFGRQLSGGSLSIPTRWLPLRQAGAAARQMLVEAAALRWEVDPSECITRDSYVIHEKTSRKLSYFDLAETASMQSVPDVADLKLKDRDEFRLLGKRIGGSKNKQLVTGEPMFGVDQMMPDLLYATYVKCPAFGGKVRSANLAEVRRLKGIVDVFILDGNGIPGELSSGIAIVAEDTWSAFKARKSLKVDWDETEAARDSWSQSRKIAKDLARNEDGGESLIAERGNARQVLRDASTTISSFYEYAFVSHAQMEPQNSTAWWHDDVMEIWAPSQFLKSGVDSVAKLLGINSDSIVAHTLRSGGGFGRRAINDPMIEAAAIARKLTRPVKLMWMREDDMAHDFYRAGGFHSLKGSVDTEGRLSSWSNHFISFTADGVNPVMGGNISGDIDPGPFVPNLEISQTLLPWKTPCGPWRAPRSNVVAFAHQSFLHELSVAAGRDHLEFLLELMGESRWLDEGNSWALHTGRAAGVIKLAAEKAGWENKRKKGHGLGLAFYFSHAGHIAQVAEVSVSENKQVNVHRVTAAVDVGPIVNLSGAENQVQGSIIDGFSTMLGQQVSFENGRALETNFHQYPLLRIPRTPDIDVHFIESDYPPTGLGEPALPPVAPAIGNAIFDATGERVRRLPIAKEGYS